jgi:uncharacterized protein with ParB-like and HNH nuclease domain
MRQRNPRLDQKLQAQQLRIAKVFSSDFHFEVPAYQRPYAWEREHVDQLVDDLVRWANDEAGKKDEDKSPYFLGSIVLEQAGNSVFEVVDGQQRLTTLALLFAAAVERLPAKDATDLTPLLRETGNKFLNTTDRQRLLPRERLPLRARTSAYGTAAQVDPRRPDKDWLQP